MEGLSGIGQVSITSVDADSACASTTRVGTKPNIKELDKYSAANFMSASYEYMFSDHLSVYYDFIRSGETIILQDFLIISCLSCVSM